MVERENFGGAAVVCVDEGWIVGARVGLGSRLWIVAEKFGLGRGWLVGAGFVLREAWIVSARVGLERGFGLCRRGWAWRAAVDCIGEVGVGAKLWFVSTRLAWCTAVDCVDEVGLARGCGLWGRG